MMLNDSDTAASWAGETLVACPGTQVPLDRPVQYARNAAARVVVPGQEVAGAMGDTQDPLPDGNVWQHVVDKVRCAFGHAPPTATRAKTPPFARERDEPFRLALATAEPREAAGKESTPQERPELVLDKPGQPIAVTEARRLGPERLEVVAHDGVHD